MRFHWKFLLRNLEREESSEHEKNESFEALASLFEELNDYDCFEDDELFERIITLCFNEMKLRVTSKDESHVSNKWIAILLLSCLQSDRCFSTEEKMLDDELIFPWMYKRILSDEDDEHK